MQRFFTRFLVAMLLFIGVADLSLFFIGAHDPSLIVAGAFCLVWACLLPSVVE